MDANFDIKSYRERWKAMDEIEQYLLDDLGQKKYGLAKRILICLGLLQDKAVQHMLIILRWAKLKDIYEEQQRKQTR